MTVTPEPSAGVLVIAVDRLPAWILPPYGATWVEMPRVNALAARGVVFDRVITTATDPRAALRHLSGVAPAAESDATENPAPATPLWAAVARRGWRAALVTDEPGVTAAELFGEGVLAEGARVTCVPPGPPGTVCGRAGDTAIARLMDAAIATVAGGCRCVFCHVSSVGVAWDAPPEYRERYVAPEDPAPPRGAAVPTLAVSADTDPDLIVGFRQVYAGQLTLLDEQIGRLLDAVAAAGGGWTVLFVGIRGLPLGLHGWMGTGGSPLPHGEVVHVPAILVDAGERMAGQRYAGLVTPADLGVTLPELIGGEPVAGRQVVAGRPWSGRSLAGLFEDWGVPERDRIVVADVAGTAFVTPAWHAILPSVDAGLDPRAAKVRVFAKPDDYFELVDVADRRPALAERLENALHRQGGLFLSAGVQPGLWLDPTGEPGGD